MITNALITVVFACAQSLFTILPSITFDYSSLVYQDAVSIIQGVLYILPASTCFAILNLIMALYGLRITVAIVKTIWDLIPIM